LVRKAVLVLDEVRRVAPSGEPLTIARLLNRPTNVALDAAFVYYATLGDYSPGNGVVAKVPR
jgi:hypothetical protein